MGFRKDIPLKEVAENFDKISFIDKTILFFYIPAFEFNSNIREASHFHSAIKKMKDFNNIRNMLLHGHMNGKIISQS